MRERRYPPNIKKAIAIMQACTPIVREGIIENLEKDDPFLAQVFRATTVSFKDIARISSRNFNKFLMAVKRDLPAALKGADEKVITKVFSGLSRTAAEDLEEDIRLAGNVNGEEVRLARDKILKVMRKMIAEKKIVLVGSDEEDEWIE